MIEETSMGNKPKGPYFNNDKDVFFRDNSSKFVARLDNHSDARECAFIANVAFSMGRASRDGLREALELFKPLIEEDRFGMISDEYRKAIEAFDKALAADDEAG